MRGVVEDLVDHSLSQPVWRVVLTQTPAGIGVDHALIQRLEHVVLHLSPVEASHASRDRPYDRGACERYRGPVEEIGFDEAVQTGGVEVLTFEQGANVGAGRVDFDLHHGVRKQLGSEDQVGVRDEQVVSGLEARAEGGNQEACPEFALELDLRVVTHRGVQRPKVGKVELEGGRAGAEPGEDLPWHGDDPVRRGQHDLEPGRQCIGVLVAAQLERVDQR